MAKSVYIHIPFCKRICTYCDFCKYIYNDEWVKDYLNRLEKEIDDIYLGEEIDTIYIGGGTPSVLKIDDLNKLFNIIKKFNINKDTEFTIECNCEDITEEKIKLFYNNNVNRISIGVESFDKKNLEIMNRYITFSDLNNKLNLIKDNGINNINLDLMYAMPGQTLKSLKKDIKLLLKLNPNHISTYSLIIEDNTILKINNTNYTLDEVDDKMYKYIIRKLKKYGYIHYEVSNFARAGFESKHNLTYWDNNEYYGFGLSSSGYLNGVRYTNTRSLTKYINSDIYSTKEILSKDDIMYYYVILGLRKIEGISISRFNDLYDIDIFDKYNINDLIKEGLLIKENDHIKINYKYIYLMNEVLSKIE